MSSMTVRRFLKYKNLIRNLCPNCLIYLRGSKVLLKIYWVKIIKLYRLLLLLNNSKCNKCNSSNRRIWLRIKIKHFRLQVQILKSCRTHFRVHSLYLTYLLRMLLNWNLYTCPIVKERLLVLMKKTRKW